RTSKRRRQPGLRPGPKDRKSHRDGRDGERRSASRRLPSGEKHSRWGGGRSIRNAALNYCEANATRSRMSQTLTTMLGKPQIADASSARATKLRNEGWKRR